MPKEKTICLSHDIERGWGHYDVDPEYAVLAHRTASQTLEAMLRVEKHLKIRATYNVVACFLHEVRDAIERGGHCIAFHSFDHDMQAEQLDRCRLVDDGIGGYRTTRNVITPELTDENLRSHHFEWLASSMSSFGFSAPRMENGIVKIPILFNDFEMYKRNITFSGWEQSAIESIKKHDFVAFGFHDCYGQHWISSYRRFLEKVSTLGTFKTLGEIASAQLQYPTSHSPRAWQDSL